MSNIVQEVKDMNVAFGKPEGNISDFITLVDTPADYDKWEVLRTQANCIPEELNELFEALDEYDINEVRDAVCDILVFTIGLGHLAGMNLEHDMHKVYESNMSKFCATQNILDLTIKKYSDMGVEVEERGSWPRKYVVSSKDQWSSDMTKLFPKGKFLKGINFEAPDFVN